MERHSTALAVGVGLGAVALCALAVVAGWFFVAQPAIERIFSQLLSPCNVKLYDDANANGQWDTGDAQVDVPGAEVELSGTNGVSVRQPLAACYVPAALQKRGVTLTLHPILPAGYALTTPDFVIAYDDSYAISDYPIGQPIYFGVQFTPTPNP